MTADEARTHIRYSGWASSRLLDAAMNLDPEQFHRDLGVPNKSVHGTLQHVCWADGIWLERIGGPPLQKGAIAMEWPQTHQYWQKFADGLTDADLTRVVPYKDTKGNPYETPLWQIVLHVVNHATLHRGQVMAMFRQLGVAPPPTDLIFYYREQQSARA
jgi:uncharacterized damage-inducible protein DinB